ncbi:hypothetical protein DEI91_05835 [Curtobacterium sp. MCBD17_032]|nr:hypothetical protein DEI91_05835 [Curtobacterium sp. MCBD17_032]
MILAAALFAAFASLVCAWSQAPLNSGDEAAHLDYAIDVWHGHLPYFYDGVTNRPPFGIIPPVQWVSQHPPFFYLVLAPFVGPLWDAGHPYMSVLAGRSANAGFAAATVLSVGWAARRVVPRRPDVAAVAAVIVSLTGMFLLVGGAIYNDLPNMTFGALAIGVAASALRSGLSARLVVGAAVVTTLGMLTRLTFVVFVLAVVVAFLLARWRRSGFWSDWRGHVVAAVTVVAAPVLASTWFWLRNIRLMGTIVGNDVAYGEQHLGRKQQTFGEVIGSSSWWKSLFALYKGHLPGNADWTYSLLLVPLVLALLVGVVTAAVVVARRLRRARRTVGARSTGRRGALTAGRTREELLADLLVVAMLVALTAAVLVGQVRFSTTGGAPNVRYSLAVMPVLAIPMAIGLTGLGRVLSAVVTVLWMETAGYIWFQIQDLQKAAFGVERTLVVSRWTFVIALVFFSAMLVGVCAMALRRRREVATVVTGDVSTEHGAGDGPEPGSSTASVAASQHAPQHAPRAVGTPPAGDTSRHDGETPGPRAAPLPDVPTGAHATPAPDHRAEPGAVDASSDAAPHPASRARGSRWAD